MTQAFFEAIDAFVNSLGPCRREVKAQVGYSVRRKFLWLWAYEKTPDGTLYLTVCLDRKLDDPNFHYVKQVSTNRWNHHVEVKSESIATSSWLRRLIRAGHEFAAQTDHREAAEPRDLARHGRPAQRQPAGREENTRIREHGPAARATTPDAG